jgi:hypothetical protein
LSRVPNSSCCADGTHAITALLLLQAPSFRLEQCIQQQHKPAAAAASDAASSIHNTIDSLRTAVQSQHTLLTSLADGCTQFQECILSQKLSGVGIDTSVLKYASEKPPTAHQDTPTGPANPPGQQDGSSTSSSSPAQDAEPHEAAAAEAAAAAESAQRLQPEEAALLMGAVVSGLQQDLQWMVSSHRWDAARALRQAILRLWLGAL